MRRRQPLPALRKTQRLRCRRDAVRLVRNGSACRSFVASLRLLDAVQRNILAGYAALRSEVFPGRRWLQI